MKVKGSLREFCGGLDETIPVAYCRQVRCRYDALCSGTAVCTYPRDADRVSREELEAFIERKEVA